MIVQYRDFGLGNFINLTPTIRALYDMMGKVPVYFESEYVKECYLKSKYIQILEEKPSMFRFGSNEINQDRPDWEYCFRKHIGAGQIPHTFIDQPRAIKCQVVIANGSANEKKFHKKFYDNELTTIVSYLVNNNYDVIFIGNSQDYEYSKGVIKRFGIDYLIDDIRTCLSLIKGSDLFISNGTGFYHAAGAMKKKQVIFWRDCNQVKNLNPNKRQLSISLYDKNAFKIYQRYIDENI